jgi:hypothetical protein
MHKQDFNTEDTENHGGSRSKQGIHANSGRIAPTTRDDHKVIWLCHSGRSPGAPMQA